MSGCAQPSWLCWCYLSSDCAPFLPSLLPFLLSWAAAKNNLHPLQVGGSHQGVHSQKGLVVTWGPVGEFTASGALPTEGWVFSAMGYGVMQGVSVQTAACLQEGPILDGKSKR